MHPDPETAKTVAKIGTTIVSKTLEKLLEDSFAELRTSVEGLRKDVEVSIEDLRKDVEVSIDSLRKDVQGSIESLRRDLEGNSKDLREEFGVLREEFRGLRKEVEALGNETRAGFARLDQRLDATTLRIDSMNERLEGRIDNLAAQQGRIYEEVTALKRDQGTTADLLHRIARIEDRVFSSAN